MLIAARDGDGSPFSNRNDSTQDQAWLGAMKAATSVLRILTPNLNDDRARRGILETVRRGVRVELILSKGFNDTAESLIGQGGDNESNLAKLAEELRTEPDACARLDVRWYATDTLRPVEGKGAFQSHAKYLSIDGQVAIIGSGNMDTQSWNKSHETNVVIDDASTTGAWDRELFDPAWSRAVPAGPCK
jgi:phosphatidylserine/phosphatidylglycerophosphate/cardiolipin synthase-like enzyme